MPGKLSEGQAESDTLAVGTLFKHAGNARAYVKLSWTLDQWFSQDVKWHAPASCLVYSDGNINMYHNIYHNDRRTDPVLDQGENVEFFFTIAFKNAAGQVTFTTPDFFILSLPYKDRRHNHGTSHYDGKVPQYLGDISSATLTRKWKAV